MYKNLERGSEGSFFPPPSHPSLPGGHSGYRKPPRRNSDFDPIRVIASDLE
jgi:hypothetical protein